MQMMNKCLFFETQIAPNRGNKTVSHYHGARYALKMCGRVTAISSFETHLHVPAALIPING